MAKNFAKSQEMNPVAFSNGVPAGCEKENTPHFLWIPVCGIVAIKGKITAKLAVIFLEMVDPKGIEPSTLRMRTSRRV